MHRFILMRAVRLSPTILTTFIFLTTAELMKPNTFLLQATTLLSAGNSGATNARPACLCRYAKEVKLSVGIAPDFN